MTLVQQFRWDRIAGWAAVAISVAILCFWASWGSIENFHEGWYYRSFWQNAALMLIQYLSPTLILMLPTLAALKWPRWSLVFFSVLAIMVWRFFGIRNIATTEMILAPLLLMGVLYQFGRPEPRKWAFRSVVGLPLLTAIVCGAVPGWRAMGRLDDGNYGARRIAGNGVSLVWAPEGPGWPDSYASWWEAEDRCQRLTVDGHTLATSPQNVWRLPTIDEAVRSMVYRGKNAGGEWNPHTGTAKYGTWPDKDSPLWKPHSQVIYWWTSTEVDEKKAYRIAYNGQVYAFPKKGWGGYWAYRCVCDSNE
jgi:hypothetical protein